MGQGAPSPQFQKSTDVKYGKYTRSLPLTYRKIAKAALQDAENRLGRPAYVVEVAMSWNRVSSKPYAAPIIVGFMLFDLYQNDEILASNNVEIFTLDPAMQGKDFERYSDRKERKFSQYTLLPNLRLVANESTPVINFEHIKGLLLSKGTDRLDEYLKLVNNECKFLDKKCDMIGNRVCLASFPRTGNSFLRKILEQITGNFTGSDMQIHRGITLQQQGMLGEQTADNSTWITKSHHPMTSENLPWTADKIIYLTRHPIDVMPSFMSLIFSQSHSIEPKRPWSEWKHWDKFLDMMLTKFEAFQDVLVKQAEKTPTFFMSYEQLILDPNPAIKKLFCFLLDIKSVEGTLVEHMIEKVTNSGNKDEKKQAYKLKATTGRLCARKNMYTAEQLKKIDDSCRDYMHFWGFASHPTIQSATQFTKYDDQTPEELANYSKFIAMNDKVLSNSIKTPEPWKVNPKPSKAALGPIIAILKSIDSVFEIKA